MVKFYCSIFVHLQQINLLNSKNLAKIGYFGCQMLHKTVQLSPKTVKISLRGEISSNLVTLSINLYLSATASPSFRR